MSIDRPDIDRSVPPFGGDRTPANAPWPILRAVLLRFSTLVFAFAALLPPAGPARAQSADASSVDFARDIRPIFDAHCVECHGPSKQKASLRLDRKKAALKGGESGPVLVPGKVAESSLLRRVTTTDTAEAMPPKGERLSPQAIARLKAWIEGGASWPEDPSEDRDDAGQHWAFRPLTRPPVPGMRSADTEISPVSSAIDAFIADRLAKSGLTPSPEASRSTLIRRLYLVMLGLAPSPEEVEAFLNDPDPKAFEKLVDRVLADPRYGERWARHWLDVVRFAETNGFETNRERPNAWRYRDYVIDAFNRDLRFDRFIREQIAGDLLGNDVATGFLVGGPVDIVGSPDPVLTAQQRADELDDMVNTTGTAFLGLTLGCARCHSHKFDPIEQREYYGLTAIFSGVRHGERPLPTPPEDERRIAETKARIAELETRLARFLAGTNTPSTPSIPASGSPVATLRPPVDSRANTEAFAPVEARFLRFTIHASTGGEPCIDELEVYSADKNVALASLGTRATASGTLPGYEIHKLEHLNDGRTGNARSWISDTSGRGWVQLEFPRPTLIDRVVWGRDRNGDFRDRVATRYEIEVASTPGAWKRVADASDRRPFTGETSPTPPPPAYDFSGVAEAEAREGRAWLGELEAARKTLAALAKPPMAYAGTFSQPPATHRLHRGDPMQKREPVNPSTLALFDPVNLPADAPESKRRLHLAEWLAHPSNPLTPRVIVNRIWQFQFGVGWVDTPNDFGRNGSPPTHPELLDWLASELVANGWSLKKLQRQILLSATWRQSSSPRADALKVDAASRLLWRFPPRRLEAEAVRDGILQLSGSLDPRRGGPSYHLLLVDRENVYHYHPKDDFGPEEFRRMVYAYKVRMEQDDVFGAFDCPDGSLVVPRRGVSTTALQALNLFNSRFVLRQSEILAERLAREAGTRTEDRIERAWRLAFQRSPTPDEAREASAFATTHGFASLGRALFNANEFLFVP